MTHDTTILKNDSTAEKIKIAARRVFTSKGFTATRTRDIAEEAGFNIALLNYYFRSKQKLFDIIMLENMQLFLHGIKNIINDPDTSLQSKLEILIGHYIDMLVLNLDLPFFVLNEIKTNPQQFAEKVGMTDILKDSIIAEQWKDFIIQNKINNINPFHYFINIISMIIFPFIANPLIKNRLHIDNESFNKLMQERKKLIPIWIKSMLIAQNNIELPNTMSNKL